MLYSPESLLAFVQTVESGSFSSAARALHKSQSTISASVAMLEADLGVQLFHRKGKGVVLTEAGGRVLPQVQEILMASARLNDLSLCLTDNVEPRLSMVISDFWQADYHHSLLKHFAERYPQIEFECLMGEDADVIDLLCSGRAHIGVMRAQQTLPGSIGSARLQAQAEMAIFIHCDHPLCRNQQVTNDQLRSVRQLRFNTWIRQSETPVHGQIWSAPSYWLLLEMAEQGFGWAILPRWLVIKYGQQTLCELPVPGWPQSIAVDAVWSMHSPPGPAGRWMIDQLCEQR